MPDTFYKDLPIGEEAEYMALQIIKKKYPRAYKKQGNFKDYDLFVPEKNISIEVKRDIGSNNSNNYFIEYKCNGCNSGIFASKSDYYAIFDENRLIWIKTDELKIISAKYGKKWVGIPEGGVSEVEAYLVNKNYIVEYSKMVTNIHESQH